MGVPSKFFVSLRKSEGGIVQKVFIILHQTRSQIKAFKNCFSYRGKKFKFFFCSKNLKFHEKCSFWRNFFLFVFFFVLTYTLNFEKWGQKWKLITTVSYLEKKRSKSFSKFWYFRKKIIILVYFSANIYVPF